MTDVAGNLLDGEWVNPDSIGDTNPLINTFPSGDGTPGGIFQFRMTVLLADVIDEDPDPDLVNRVDSTEYTIWANGFGSEDPQYGDGGYSGNDNVDGPDYTLWANNFGVDFTVWGGGAAAAAASSGPSKTGAAAAFDYVVALYENDTALVDDETLNLLAEESAGKQKPLWEQHAKNFFDWNGKEIKHNGLEGFLDELEEFLMPQS